MTELDRFQLACTIPSRLRLGVDSDGTWIAQLDGHSEGAILGQGSTQAEAEQDLVLSIIEYKDQWDHFKDAPNHYENASLVLIATLLTQDEVHEWLTRTDTA